MTRSIVLTALLTLSLCAPAHANELTPNDVRERYPLVSRAPCSDNETGERGHCFVFAIPSGGVYMVFVQSGEPVFMRRTLQTAGYETVWSAESGIPI